MKREPHPKPNYHSNNNDNSINTILINNNPDPILTRPELNLIYSWS